MSRARHTSRLVLAMLILATGLLAPVVVQPHEAVAKNSYTVHQPTRTITITVNVNVIGANAPDVISTWIDAFNKTWGKPFRYSCWTVTLELAILPGFERRPGEHTVFIVETRPGQLPSEVRYPLPYNPVEDSVTGYWQHPPRAPGTIAHEFGHVFGLQDKYLQFYDKNGRRYSVPDPTKAPEYTWKDNGDGVFDVTDVWNDRNNNRLVDRGEVTPPTLKAGETMSFMADNRGQVLSRHIKGIVEKHVDPDELKCNWRGSWEHRGLDSNREGESTVSHLMSFTMEEDDAGVLEGTGIATITNEGGGTVHCGTWTARIEPVTVDIAVSGQRTDEWMTLSFTPLGDTQATMEYNACGVPSSYTFDAWNISRDPIWTLPRSPVDNTYALDEHSVLTHSTGKQETWFVFIVEPADDEGAPVG